MSSPTECVHLKLPRLQEGGQEPEETKRLQHMLNDVLDANLDVTGGYGEKTQRAVKKFQQQQGLVQNEKVGEETWAALLKRWLSG